ncbi:MAG: Asp23/Gls24 family envelope stress response protein, partial [Clostridia bacterium]
DACCGIRKADSKVCNDVQEGVRKSIETMTGLHVVRVDVHVQGVSFEKETKELQQGSQKAKIDEMLAQETRPVKVEAPSKMETPMPAKADEEIDVEIPEMEEDEAEDVTEEAALDVEEMQEEPEDASTDTQEKLEDPESETLPEKDASR